MEPDTLGREAVQPVLTPIRKDRTPQGKCYVSFSITLPTDARLGLSRLQAFASREEW